MTTNHKQALAELAAWMEKHNVSFYSESPIEIAQRVSGTIYKTNETGILHDWHLRKLIADMEKS